MWNLLKKDSKIRLQSKRIWMVLSAVLIITIIGTAFRATKEQEITESPLSIGLIDLDNSKYSKLMVSYFEDSKVFKDYVKVIVGNREEIETLFQKGELTMCLEIPKDFATNLINIENIPMKAIISLSDTTKAIILKNMLLGYEKYISAVEVNCVSLYDIMEMAGMPEELIEAENENISYDLVFTALGRTDFFRMEELKAPPRIPIVTYYGFELLFLILSYLSVFAGMDLIKEEKNGLLSRLISMNIKMTTIVTEKLLMNLSMLAAGFGIYSFFGYLNLTPKLSLHVIMYCILFFLLANGFFMLVGVFFRKIPTYLLVSNLVILFMAILGAGFIPIQYLPSGMRVMAGFSPNYWFLKTGISLYLKEETVSSFYILTSLIATVVFALAIGMLYRRKEGIVREDL